jgi:hypothetical protein
VYGYVNKVRLVTDQTLPLARSQFHTLGLHILSILEPPILAIAEWGMHACQCESCTSMSNVAHSQFTMDLASQALTEALATDGSTSYRALADKKNVPRSTLHRRKHEGA